MSNTTLKTSAFTPVFQLCSLKTAPLLLSNPSIIGLSAIQDVIQPDLTPEPHVRLRRSVQVCSILALLKSKKTKVPWIDL